MNLLADSPYLCVFIKLCTDSSFLLLVYLHGKVVGLQRMGFPFYLLHRKRTKRFFIFIRSIGGKRLCRETLYEISYVHVARASEQHRRQMLEWH